MIRTPLDRRNDLACIALEPKPFSSVTRPSWTIRLADKSSGSASPTFLAPEPEQGDFVVAHDDAGVRASDKMPAIFRFKVIYGFFHRAR
jgi:hypothetical protein